MTDISLRFVVLALCLGALVSVGSASTLALFVDSHQGSGSFTAANSFGGGGGGGSDPPGKKAYNDADGDGEWDSNEATYTEQDLYNFQDTNVDLVIPSDVGDVKAKNRQIDINANSITTEVGFDADNGVSVTATGGDVTLNGNAVTAKNGGVKVTAAGTVSADRSKIRGPTGDVVIRGETVSLRQADVKSKNNDVIIAATEGTGGTLDATDSSIEASTGTVSLESVGDVYLDSAKVRSKNGGATADLGTTSATLHVDGAEIDDNNQILAYDPDGIAVDGSPKKGCVAPTDGSCS